MKKSMASIYAPSSTTNWRHRAVIWCVTLVEVKQGEDIDGSTLNMKRHKVVLRRTQENLTFKLRGVRAFKPYQVKHNLGNKWFININVTPDFKVFVDAADECIRKQLQYQEKQPRDMKTTVNQRDNNMVVELSFDPFLADEWVNVESCEMMIDIDIQLDHVLTWRRQSKLIFTATSFVHILPNK